MYTLLPATDRVFQSLTKGATQILTVLMCAFGQLGLAQSEALTPLLKHLADSLLIHYPGTGLSIGVVAEGNTHTYHAGSVGPLGRPTDSTLYEIASLTKTMTGTLVAQAILEGRLALDADVRDYLDESFPALEFEGQPITVRHLLTHRSGMPRLFPPSPGLFDNPDRERLPDQIVALQAGQTRAQFIEHLREVRLDTLPGSSFGYSNAGANLLGLVLEQVYDETYETLVHDLFTKRIGGMTHSGTDFSTLDTIGIAYGTSPLGTRTPFRANKALVAEGGVLSCTEDMMRYIEFQFREDDPVVQLSRSKLLDDRYGDFNNGFFWQLMAQEGGLYVFQNGGAFGTSSWLGVVPEDEVGVFIVINRSAPGVHQRLSEAVNMILAHYGSSGFPAD